MLQHSLFLGTTKVSYLRVVLNSDDNTSDTLPLQLPGSNWADWEGQEARTTLHLLPGRRRGGRRRDVSGRASSRWSDWPSPTHGAGLAWLRVRAVDFRVTCERGDNAGSQCCLENVIVNEICVHARITQPGLSSQRRVSTFTVKCDSSNCCNVAVQVPCWLLCWWRCWLLHWLRDYYKTIIIIYYIQILLCGSIQSHFPQSSFQKRFMLKIMLVFQQALSPLCPVGLDSLSV